MRSGQARPVYSVPWIVSAGLLAVVLAYLPVFLLAGLSAYIREALSLSLLWLGIGTAIFFTASAISAAFVGRLCDRFGGITVLRVGSSLSAVALILMALGGVSVWLINAGLIVGGVANGLSQTGANVMLYDFVQHVSQGRVFAVKQSAAPIVTFVAGFAISMFVPHVSWQLILVAAAAVFYLPALVSWSRLPRTSHARPLAEPQTFRLRSEPGLFVLAFVSFLAFGAATAAVAYFVESLADTGVELEFAGRLLMAGSVAGVVVRLVVGVALDWLDLAPLLVCLTMTTVGAVGFILMAGVSSTAMLVIATILVFGAGWGWPGMFVLGVVRSFPDKAGWASGMVQLGSALGAAAGPLLFGAVSSTLEFRFAWGASAAAMLVSSALLYVWYRHSRGRPAAA